MGVALYALKSSMVQYEKCGRLEPQYFGHIISRQLFLHFLLEYFLHTNFAVGKSLKGKTVLGKDNVFLSLIYQSI